VETVEKAKGISIKEGSSCVQILRELPKIAKGNFRLAEEEEEVDHMKEAEGMGCSTET